MFIERTHQNIVLTFTIDNSIQFVNDSTCLQQ